VEVDDVDSNVMTRTRLASAWAATPTCSVPGAEGPRLQAPKGAGHGTGLSIAGTSEQVSGAFTTAAYAGVFAGQAALVGVRTTDLPGTPPRGAPV
jgi:hypothetical protein